MEIRLAKIEALDKIKEIYDSAKTFMDQSGNQSQWINGYPQKELLAKNITDGDLYICAEEDKIVGVFCFFQNADDPTYRKIYNGKWLNDKPYGTIHRMASDGAISGLLEKTMPFCLGLTDNVRIDTHADNKPMLDAVRRYGFRHCGVIYVADGSPREAFQYAKTGGLNDKSY